jgi:nucleoside diphosphate kinase
LRTLIIAKPAAVNGGAVSGILKMAEEAGLKGIGLKAEALDAHHLKRDIDKEKDLLSNINEEK